MALSADGIGQLATLLDRGFHSTAFQPIVETRSGASVGFESLLRGPEGSLLEEPGRIFNEQDLVPDEWRLRIDHASIQAAVRTAKLLPGEVLIFITILEIGRLFPQEEFDLVSTAA